MDDNRAIHGDFRKVLGEPSHEQSALAALEAALFGQAPPRAPTEPFLIDSAFQGQEARALVEKARDAGKPYAVAFVDMRMPPGWDGVETAQRLWEVDPELQVVVCTAYSDYSWEELLGKLEAHAERFLILKKPFDHVEVRQLATSLARKWTLARQARARVDELEALVGERTRAIREAHERLQREVTQRHRMEAQLRRAQKLEALGRLAAGIAHEINNPLAFVIANLQYVREAIELPPEKLASAPLDELASALAEACVGGDRIKQIVRDLKAFAQPHDESLAVVDVRPVLEFSLKMAGAEIRRRAQLITRVDEVPAVWAISGRLEQVFVNLLVNAAQSIAPGAVEQNQIRVTVRRLDSDVAVEIADTGVGIPAANLERIFDPFFTTKPVGVGTGLGLSICHSIVTAFGGDLTVESEEGKGSMFRVTLPSATGAESGPHRASGLRLAPAARILVVDAEPAVAKAIRRVLSGHKVQTADGGVDALARLSEQPFDLVLYDVMTRDLPAPELYSRLQEMGHGLERRLALTAAGALPPDVAKLVAEAGVPCVDKPFDAGEIDLLLSTRAT
ncbi:MAG TPA: ATP-binding protein [Polyangia bacterium]|nr:ATP-binding protein [Polyangia bacterium]